MDQNNQSPALTLSIRDAERSIFEGIVDTISSYNDKGLFDVMPFHENFITSIRDKIVVRNQGNVKEYLIDKAIMKVESNVISVFLLT